MNTAAHSDSTEEMIRTLAADVSRLSNMDRETVHWFIKRFPQLNLLLDAVCFTPEQRAQFQREACDANDLLLMILAEFENRLHSSADK